ncbi:putative peroxiredoxin [compost metagenome]
MDMITIINKFYYRYITPVCTTEFISFAKYYPEFLRRNTYLLGLSVDSNASHLAWIYNIYKSTGIQIPFPIISDRNMNISTQYNMVDSNVTGTQTIRSVFIIDPNQRIRAILQYPMTNGRNIGEILRLLEAIQTTDRDNVVTPANW